MKDETEGIRRALTAEVNKNPSERAKLETQYGTVWNTEELSRDFEVKGFMAPFVIVKRKIDGKTGSLMFQHSPRYYFSFTEDS
jgi:hypothetical protein